jgi:hypothetical protein
MDSLTNRPRRTRRNPRAILNAETLEGRQLLSTTTTAADTSATTTAEVGTTTAPTTLATHHLAGTARAMTFGFHVYRAGRHHGASVSSMPMMAALPFAGGAGMVSATAAIPSVSATPADPSTSVADATYSTGTVAPATPAAPTSGTAGDSPAMVTLSSAGSLQSLPSLGMGGAGMMGGMVAPVGIGGGFGGGGVMVSRGGFGPGLGFNPGGPMMGLGQGSTVGTVTVDSSGTSTTDPRATALKQYMTDVQSIADKSQVTPALQAALRNDLQALAKDATTAPDETKVLALESDVQTLAGTLPTSDALATLQSDFAAAVASEGVTDTATIAKAGTDLDALIAAKGITSDDVATLTKDLKAAGMSTAAPLGPKLGIDLGILNLAIKMDAGKTTTTTASTTTTTSTSTAAGSSTSTS